MKSKVVLSLAALVALAGFGPSNDVIFDQFGNKLPDSEVNSDLVHWKLLSIKDSKRFNGYGLVDIFGGGGCTGTFLDTGAGPDGPAYVLSNGHCAGPELMGPRDVVVDATPAFGMNFRFNYFIDAGQATRRVGIRKVTYATMHLTDIAIFELDATFGQVVRAGFTPYAISEEDPSEGTTVEMVGVPQSGVKRQARYLRRSTCQIGGRANLSEGGYSFAGAFRHGCSSVGGSSGSAMVSLKTGKIVAINNTGVNDNAKTARECALNRPCEIARDGVVTTNFNVNYAQRVSDIPSCFNSDGVFDLKLEDCRLERP